RIEEDEILDEDEACDIVEALLVDREPRILLLAKQLAQVADRRFFANRHDVGTRRHHFADEGIAKIDDALQQPPFFALDDAFLLGVPEIRLRDLVGLLPRFVGVGWPLRLPPRGWNRPRDPT